MRPAHRLFLPFALAALLVAGCGSSSDSESETGGGPSSRPAVTTTSPTAPPGAGAESCGNTTVAGTSQLQASGVGCAIGRGIVAAWANDASCAAATSRPSCTVYDGYRCIGARTDAGIAVSCARPGRSVSFVAKRD
jgi:hypothetical protein